MDAHDNDPPRTGQPLVLIVDDTPENLRVLGTQLEDEGFDVAVADTGEKAIRILEGLSPDIILLDVMMPGMDGFEVCEKLKGNPGTGGIPVIFLTARTETDDIVRAFEAGAVDYLSKPYRSAELLARVRTHIELRRSRETIAWHARTLRDLNAKLHAVLKEKDEFLGIAAHDLKNPLAFISMTANIIRCGGQDAGWPKVCDYAHRIERMGARMADIITNLLELNELETGQLTLASEPFDIAAVAAEAAREFREKAESKNISIALHAPDPVIAVADRRACFQVFDNLISNAIKFSAEGLPVEISVSRAGAEAICSVTDHGPGLTDADKSQLFMKFARLSAKPTAGENSTGLGLSIVKKLLESMRGRVWCESEFGRGATFSFALPTPRRPPTSSGQNESPGVDSPSYPDPAAG